MEDYLVDVAVKINIWIRPDMLRRQFEVLRQARPRILFIQSDGGRNESECASIRIGRAMYDEEIDWNCTVYKLYEDRNLGMYTMGRKTREFVWEHVDACIFLEDDIIPAVSYFRFCAEMFVRYRDDPRIYGICGVNCIGVNENCSADYFFARYNAITGIGMWKRSYEQYRTDFLDDAYTMSLLEDAAREHPTFRRQLQAIAADGEYEGHVPWDEFYVDLAAYGHHQMLIVPRCNMISNLGCDALSTHSDELRNLPKGIRKLFNMELHELEWPLKIPQYEIPDLEYERKRNRMLALDHPVISAYRKLERTFLIFVSGDFGKLKRKIGKYIDKRKMHEE